MNRLEGVIVKGIGGFYTVAVGERSYVCRARGRFRRDRITPAIGDRVRILPPQGEEDGFIEEILPRANLLVRPPVANITRVGGRPIRPVSPAGLPASGSVDCGRPAGRNRRDHLL